MLKWLQSMFSMPKPAGPPRVLKAFAPGEATITKSDVRAEDGGWRIDAREKQTVRLFEVPNPGVEQCQLAYRAELRTEGLRGRAYLEMWCRLPGGGEYFSKGFHNAVKGTTGWSSVEIPFFLRKGQVPDLVKLNVEVEGTGTVWVRNIELRMTPLA